MNRIATLLLSTGTLAVAACVTINVYFPAAAAEKAADRIIDDVWGPQQQRAPAEPPPASTTPQSRRELPARLLVVALDALVPAAHAQADPNIDISSPEIDRIKALMENRFTELKGQFDAGVVGLTHDGYVAQRDPSLVPLAVRNLLRTLIGNENADRAALYREIARSNGHPEWETQIREVFAQRWIAKASSGWWYQDADGQWKKK